MLQGLRTENLKIRSANDVVRSAIFCIFSKFCFHQFLYLNRNKFPSCVVITKKTKAINKRVFCM